MQSDPTLSPNERLSAGRHAVERGNSLRSHGEAGIRESLGAYDEAVALLGPLCSAGTSPIHDDLASAWTNRGIALMAAGGSSSFEEALACFDTALELRVPLVALGNPWHRYNLMGVWINRGDAQASLGGSSRIADAVRCYDEALSLGGGLDTGLSDEFPRRIAVAYLNRGTALRQLQAPERLEEACLSYDSAIETLSPFGIKSSPAGQVIAAAAWVGKAEALGDSGAEGEAISCARRAMELAAPMECDRPEAATVGLKARLVLCAAASRSLARLDSPASDSARIAEAIDMAEDGLRLAGRWGGGAELQPLIQELFRFGTQAYAARQPHFLVEFIGEFLPMAQAHSAATMRVISAQAVALAIGNVATEGILTMGQAGIDDTVATFRDLRLAQERFAGAVLGS